MPSIDSMSKQEFADYALTQGVTLNISMTKVEMVEDYNKSLNIIPDITAVDTPVVDTPVVDTPAPEVTVVAPPSVDTLFAEAQARNAEEERIAALTADEQVELVQWTVEEAIGILRYAISRGKK